MAKRSGVLEFAVLGLLHESPMHGYELRKRLNVLLGSLRVFSYGSLYPCLKELVAYGWLVEDADADPAPRRVAAKSVAAKGAAAAGQGAAPRRSKIVYRLTPEGEERFKQLLSDAGPSAWEDENFGVHFAFFGRTDAAVRLRILEGRRSRLEERLDLFRQSVIRTRERLDRYTLEAQRHGLESVEREVRWLNELIKTEHDQQVGPQLGPPAG
ncbi:PadR family transcriptional regulator [Actinocrinis puniceicyclus]|uniref:PadR family transcriptional regulator n=1 Tax=Actinocrinis puniceicyclus TaxID=977794 RepID=A0A8J8BC61_9ACTN|nr:PadR family transcriptional regulator [Actinocrinis puniceicyclus]MBS2964792.1 PadR family transcriptional regulator [Actinocrinis puniceicyclus]